MVNERVTDWLLTWFDDSIVTERDDTDLEGVPDTNPVVRLSDRPMGRDPEVMENDKSSPFTVGVIATGLSLDRVYCDWG